MAVLLLGGIAMMVAVAPAAAAPARVQIEGRVIDADGEAVAGAVVRLLMTRSLIRPAQFALEDQVVEGARSRTDEDGFFKMEVDRGLHFKKYFLRFYDPEQFDPVRFEIPADREITRKWKSKRPVLVTTVLQHTADWPTILEWIDRYGRNSQAARILRSLGLPDRVVETGAIDRVDWCFVKAAICYQLEGNRVLGQTTPVAARVLAPDGSGHPPEDQPAENR